MSIRDENNEWSKEAKDLSLIIGDTLKPIFNEYKDKFTFEELYYLVCTKFHEIILLDILREL